MYTYICIKCVLTYVPIYVIIYTDKGKADNPQTAERVFKMKRKFYSINEIRCCFAENEENICKEFCRVNGFTYKVVYINLGY